MVIFNSYVKLPEGISMVISMVIKHGYYELIVANSDWWWLFLWDYIYILFWWAFLSTYNWYNSGLNCVEPTKNEPGNTSHTDIDMGQN